MTSGGELGGRAASAVKRGLISLVPPLIAVALAFIVGALVLQVTGYDPVEAYSALMRGAFGDVYAAGQTLSRATPIIFTALAFLFAMKCGLFNIGAEGQLIVGALGSALAGIYLSGLPPVVHASLALLAGALVGGLWGLIPAVLKAYFGAHEVITTMMLSYVAEYLTGYLVNYPFKAPGWVAQTVPIAATSRLPRILQPTQLSAAVFIAVALAALTQFLLHNTAMGYEIRAIGLNVTAAENAGISVKRGVLIALLISGAMAGLGGSGEILGVHRRFIEGFSPGYGWDGLAVALVGGLHPIGVILAAILFGALRSGGMVMTRATGVPLDIVLLLQALVIVFVSAPMLIRHLLRKVGYRW